MSEWWTYTLTDFLMFSPRTYWRLVELYNREVWPLHLAAIATGLAAVWLARRGPQGAARSCLAILALGSAGVAWGFHWERYAQVNLAAPWLAAAFGLQAALLLAAAAFTQPRAASRMGVWIAVAGVLLYPLSAVASGRPLVQAEVFGLMPDPTALVTLALARPWWLRVLPAAMLVIGALTHWAMLG